MIFKILVLLLILIPILFVIKLAYDLILMRLKWKRYHKVKKRNHETKEFEKSITSIFIDLDILKESNIKGAKLRLSGFVTKEKLKELTLMEIDFKYLHKELDLLK